MPKKSAGAGRGFMNPPVVQPDMTIGENEMVQEAKDAKDRQRIKDMGFSKGGSVGSASKRADGIAQRGKTRGTMVMCGGGKM